MAFAVGGYQNGIARNAETRGKRIIKSLATTKMSAFDIYLNYKQEGVGEVEKYKSWDTKGEKHIASLSRNHTGGWFT